MFAFFRNSRLRLFALSAALIAAALFGASVFIADAAQRLNIHDYVRGRIMLQVQERGEAWYVYPGDDRRYFLGSPSDAYQVMKALGLGVHHQLIADTKIYPAALLGEVLLDVDDHGKAYYVNPGDATAYYLGSAAQAFDVMRKVGVGVTDADLLLIHVSAIRRRRLRPARTIVPIVPRTTSARINSVRVETGLRVQQS